MDGGLAKVKVAVVGVGHLGQHHARIYTELPGVELVAVADVSDVRRREVGGRLGVPAVSDYRTLLGTVDAVSVAVPTGSHYPIALSFLQGGSDVLVEKPITQTVGEADVLIAAAAKGGRILQGVSWSNSRDGTAASCRSVTANGTMGRCVRWPTTSTSRASSRCTAWARSPAAAPTSTWCSTS